VSTSPLLSRWSPRCKETSTHENGIKQGFYLEKDKEVEDGVAVQDRKFDYSPNKNKLLTLSDYKSFETLQPANGKSKNAVGQISTQEAPDQTL